MDDFINTIVFRYINLNISKFYTEPIDGCYILSIMTYIDSTYGKVIIDKFLPFKPTKLYRQNAEILKPYSSIVKYMNEDLYLELNKCLNDSYRIVDTLITEIDFHNIYFSNIDTEKLLFNTIVKITIDDKICYSLANKYETYPENTMFYEKY